MKRVTALLILFLYISLPLLAWGPTGHQVIAEVAASRLTPSTRQNVRLLLGNDDLAAVSLWADQIRRERPETFAWHFVDIPKDAAGFSYPRDCYRPQDTHPGAQTDHDNCVVSRIDIFRKLLADPGTPYREHVEALKFLVHFVADVHQPLHGIDVGRGGNDIHVVVFGVSQCGRSLCNLHEVWDLNLIDHAGLSVPDYVKHLDDLIAKDHLSAKAGGTPEDWANESHLAARQVVDENATSIDEAYFRANIGLVDQRLALAGLRLARLLNETLGRIPEDQLKRQLPVADHPQHHSEGSSFGKKIILNEDHSERRSF